MPSFAQQIAYHLQQFRQGNADAAFHGLEEMEHGVLPDLIAEFRATKDVKSRAFLLNVIWQHRQQSVIPFLGEALFDSEPIVWRKALDGLVALASPAALEVLRAAKERQFSSRQDSEEFLNWIQEAIEQVETETPEV
jgi:hypothetical protein